MTKPTNWPAMSFVKNHIKEYNTESIFVSLVGGEPLLRPEKCLEIIHAVKTLNIKTTIAMSTNLTVDITEPIINIIKELKI